MEKYNYREELKNDIRAYIADSLWFNEDTPQERDYDDVYNDLYEEMWVADSVTGNASGSYTFSTWRAEENLCHNTDLIEEVIDEWGAPAKGFKGAEYWDVSIRCYLLGECLSAVLDEYYNNI